MQKTEIAEKTVEYLIGRIEMINSLLAHNIKWPDSPKELKKARHTHVKALLALKKGNTWPAYNLIFSRRQRLEYGVYSPGRGGLAETVQVNQLKELENELRSF